jgi:hypothetical protein
MMMTIELREIDHYNGKAYEVVRDGEVLGCVRHCFPTFERGPRQATWVTKRWRPKRPYWEYVERGAIRPSIDYPTRKRAVEQLIDTVGRNAPHP